MSVTDGVIESWLRSEWPGVTVEAIEPLTGGFWAAMFRVRITGQPAGVPGEVVVRIAPDQAMGAKEAEVQRTVSAQGYPTPRVWLSAPDGGGGWCSVMELVDGGPLLADLDGVGALRRAPSLARSLPGQLAQVMAELHRIDRAPVSAAVDRVAPSVAWSTLDVLSQLDAGAASTGRADVGSAVERLRSTMPNEDDLVLCHGDLHPFNVLDDGRACVVIDWTGAVVSHPCFDLALTELLLANPPLQLPRPLAPVARGAGRFLARLFINAYRRANPQVTLSHLGWFRALHSARVLIDVTSQRNHHSTDGQQHPWTQVAPAAAKHLSTATGMEIQP